MELPPMETMDLSDGEQPRKLAVLGLPWDTSEETLRAYFSQFGGLEHAEIMKDRYSGKSRGFGFVTFLEAAGAQRALLTDHSIDGRRCEAKVALPKGEPSPPRTTRIFVARVPPSVSEAQFRVYFETFGKLQDAYMPRDHSKQGYRGIGFVTFASPDSVEKVMAVKHWMHGHEIAIDRATPKEEPAGMKNMFNRPAITGGQRRSFDNGANIIGPGLTSVMQMNAGLSTIGEGHNVVFPSMRSLSEDRELDDMAIRSAAMGHGGMGAAYSHDGGPGGGGAGGAGGAEYAGMSSSAMRAGQALGISMGGNASAATSAAAMHSLAKAQTASHQQMPDGGGGGGGGGGNFSANALTSQLGGLQLGPGGGMHSRSNDLSVSFPYSGGMGHARPTGSQDSNSVAVQQMLAAAAGRRSLDAAIKRMENPAIATARAGPRIFVGKLTKDTSEADVKDYFMRFGYVMDVYLPKAKDNKAEHRGF